SNGQDPSEEQIKAYWDATKQSLQISMSEVLDRLVKNSYDREIRFAEVYEGEPKNAFAISSEKASLGSTEPIETIGPPGSPERVMVYEGYLNGGRARRFDKPVVVNGNQVEGTLGKVFVSIYVDAAKIDDVRSAITG